MANGLVISRNKLTQVFLGDEFYQDKRPQGNRNTSGFEAGKHEKGTAPSVRQHGEGLTEVSCPVESRKVLQ